VRPFRSRSHFSAALSSGRAGSWRSQHSWETDNWFSYVTTVSSIT